MAADTTSLSGLAGRYATALIELAGEKKQLDSVAEDLKGLKSLIGESEDLRTLIRSPLYRREQQTAAIGALLEKAGVNDITRRFVMVVAKNKRLFVLPKIIDAFLAELARRRGEVTAEVTAAHELSDDQRHSLAEALRKAVGSKVQVALSVDPSILGGLVVKVGSRMIDNSVRTKLQRLQLVMKGVG